MINERKNSCILITSHLNNSINIDVAIEQLKMLESVGLPIIYSCNYFIPIDIQSKVDYAFYDKENPEPNNQEEE